MFDNSYLKWAGGKRLALKHIMPIINRFKFHTLVEPFFGSGIVGLNANPSSLIANDINADLMATHRAVIETPDEVIAHAQALFKCGSENFYDIRKIFNEKNQTSIAELAAQFIYINRFGYNGLCRYNGSGKINTPVGKKVGSKPTRVPVTEISRFSLLRNQSLMLSSKDFGEFFNTLEVFGHTLIYCDPPYVPLTSSFDYSADGFSSEQQIQLVAHAKRSRMTTLISNHWTPFTMNLYSDADELHMFDVPRTISSNGKERKQVREVLAIYHGKGSLKCPTW